MTITHDFGDNIVKRATFKDKNGTIGDPTAVYASYKKPSGQEVTLTYPNSNLAKISTGVYDLIIDVDENTTGTWFWRIWGTGSLKAADEGSFNVNEKYANPTAATNTITTENIVDLVKAPKEITTDEGSVKERSVKELIEAEKYIANKEAITTPLHGLVISRAKPGGAV